MSKFSFSVYLNAYNDAQPSNSPSQNNFKWNRDLASIIVNNPTNQMNTIAPGETRNFFNGSRTLAQDGSTTYSISPKPLSTVSWVLAWDGGTAPDFRTSRANGADNTSQVTVVVNGPIVTFTSTGGTSFNLAAVQIGDWVTVSGPFNVLNQGTFQVIAKTANSFTVEIITGTNEGPITLTAASDCSFFSAAGVQVGDTLVINAGFSQASWGSYEVTAVYAESLEFAFTGLLPTESAVQANVAIYSDAKQFVYVEADSDLHVIVNGVDIGQIEPFMVNNASSPSLPPALVPGVFMLKSTVYSLSVTNNGINPANCYFAAVE